MSQDWVTTKVPRQLFEDAEEKHKEEGFRSVPEAIRYLLRRWLDE
jgi:Arc/MetJ-type ribon-helix-helix transcriptional regulator